MRGEAWPELAAPKVSIQPLKGRSEESSTAAFPSSRLPSRRDHCGGSDPPRRVLIVRHCVRRLTSSRAARADKKGGSLPPLPPPPVRRHAAPCEAGTTQAGAALRFTAEDSRNPCQLASNADSRAQPGPQRRGLRPLREERWGCQKRAPPDAPPDAPPPLFQWRMNTTPRP